MLLPPRTFSLTRSSIIDDNRQAWTARLGRIRNKAQRNARARGFTENFRSGLELNVAMALRSMGVAYEFEGETIHYVVPAADHKYTPDFKIVTRSGRTIYIETKGRMEGPDRKKHLYLREQHPDLDIRLVFSNPYTWDRRARTRSYAKWADAHGITWCSRSQLKKKLAEWANE